MYPKPKKRLGQNFLTDKNIQKKIVKVCKLKKTDIILEIGPGRGELTQYLLKAAKRVIAVEVDKELCELLTSKFSSSRNFELVNKDILRTNLVNLVGCQGSERIMVIANIPYYISTPIIAHLLDYNESIEIIYLSLQKELAARLTAGPGNKSYGALGCFVQFYTQPKILFSIKRSSFWPRPKVDSCFVELKMLPEPKVAVKNETFFFKLISLAFNQRRKLLKNSLARLFPQSKISDCLKAIGLKEKIRAEDLSLSDFARVADYLT